MTLEELLRDLDKRGELNTISLCATASGFHCSFTPASTYGILRASHADPVEAIRLAVKQAKLARPSAAPHYEPGSGKRPGIKAIGDDLDFG